MAAPLRLIGYAIPAVLLLACESSSRPTPSPGAPNGETITGNERIGWDQQAASTSELSSFRYAIYVDGNRSEIAGVSCATTQTDAGFACSGRLPTMSPGVHVLQIAAFTTDGGLVEGPTSAPLQVMVAGTTAPAPSSPLRTGEQITTLDRATLVAERIVENLDEPNDVAIAPDGRVFIAEASGDVHVLAGDTIEEALSVPDTARTGGILRLALSPDYERSGHVFTLQAVASDAGTPAFRLVRYRVQGHRLVEQMIVLRDVAASGAPSGSLRFGPDGKLYAAFDDAGNAAAAASLSEWEGKILRLEADGRTPDDQPAGSPVFWSALHAPAGVGWRREGGLLWMTERGADGFERLRAIGMSADQPRRTEQRATYVLPRPLGAATLAAYDDTAIPQFTGNLFVAARDGGYLLRAIFEDGSGTRVVRSERLLENRVGSVRAVAAHDGALYFCTSDALWRLTAVATPAGRGSR